MMLVMEPASSIITMCGGYAEVARITGRSLVRVRRWTYPKERGGTGGLVPSDCQQVLLEGARQNGVNLKPEHFFERVPPLRRGVSQ